MIKHTNNKIFKKLMSIEHQTIEANLITANHNHKTIYKHQHAQIFIFHTCSISFLTRKSCPLIGYGETTQNLFIFIPEKIEDLHLW